MESAELGVHVSTTFAHDPDDALDFDVALTNAAKLVRRQPRGYDQALAYVVAKLNAVSGLGEADRLAMLLAIVDKLASAAIAGAVDAGAGREMQEALRAGRFDAYLQPESRSALIAAAG